jgi:Holliday junction resolvasome RuvABC endonuclease subunit
MKLVAGLDLSLSSTGILGAQGHLRVIRQGSRRGHDRLDYIIREILPDVLGCVLVAVEGPSYGSASLGGHEELSWLRGTVQRELWLRGIPFVVVSPASLKMFATGNGRASKDEVHAAAEAWHGAPIEGPVKNSKYDMADALWLARLAVFAVVGHDVTRLSNTQAHGRELEATRGCDWTYASDFKPA